MSRLFTGLFCGYFILVSYASIASPLEVTAEVNPNPVLVNESFQLTITANQRLPQRAFPTSSDFSELEASSASVSTQTQVTNGQREEVTRWHIRLMADEDGVYDIPAFDIAGAQTQPVSVEVLPESAADQLERRQAFVRAELDTREGWLNQQFIYTTRLYLAAPLQRGHLSAPQAEHADIEQLGQDQEREELIDGQRYRVIVRTYSITPRRSGELTITGAEFDGELQSQSQRGFGFQRGEQVRTRASTQQIQVAARPDDFPGDWLPSAQVTLEEQWEPERDMLDYGEPVTRTIEITAENVAADRLRLPDLDYPADIRAYPDRGQRENFVSGGRSLARATFNQVLIPTATGELTAPAMKVPWWNTQTGEVEYAELPERTITVQSAPGDMSSPRATVDPEQVTPDTTATDTAPTLPTTTTAAETTDTAWWWQALALASLGLWLVTIAAWSFYTYRHRAPRAEPQGLIPGSARQALAELKIACYNNNAKAARRHLLSWQRIRQQQSEATLEDIARDLSDPTLSQELARLNAALYGPTEGSDWQDGKNLWLALQELHLKAQQGQADSLPPLYPHHS